MEELTARLYSQQHELSLSFSIHIHTQKITNCIDFLAIVNSIGYRAVSLERKLIYSSKNLGRDSHFALSSAVGPGPEELSGAGRRRPENL